MAFQKDLMGIMDLTVQTVRYIVKNFIYIIPFAAVAGVMFAVMFDYDAQGEILGLFFTGEIGQIDFYLLLRTVSLLNLSSVPYAFISLVASAAVGVALAMMMALVEKHMRIGRKTLNGIWSKLNDNLVSTFAIVGFYLAVYEFWAVMSCAVLYALITIFSFSAAAQYVTVCAAYVGLFAALLYVAAMFYLWLPCLQITGFSFYDSLKYSFQLLSGIKTKLVLQFAVSLCAAGLLILGFTALSYFVVEVTGVIAYIAVAVVYTALFMLFCIRQEVAYFETDQMDRVDLQPSYKHKY